MKQANIPKVILVVEDDRMQREVISEGLRREGYFVLAVANVAQAASIACENPLSLIILNSALLPAHECDLYRQLRSHSDTEHTPLLLLISNEDERASFWRSEVEVEDFITKPFLWEELHACVATLLRSGKRKSRQRPPKISHRSTPERHGKEAQVLVADDLCIDVIRHKVVRRGQHIEVGSALLFELLVYLVRHRGIVLSRDQLLTQVWGYASDSVNGDISRTVSVHMHWLRQLLEDDPNRPQLIQTIRGVGYRFAE